MTSTSHRLHEYSADIVNGKILACNLVRLACKRHLDDLVLSEDSDFPYYFDQEKCDHCLDWIENICYVFGRNYKLPDWLLWMIGNWAGWRYKKDRRRRFDTVLAITPKSSGKSKAMAALALYQLTADKSLDFRKEIIVSANTSEQALVIMRAISEFLYEHPSLLKRVHQYGGRVKPEQFILKDSYGIGYIKRVSGDTTNHNIGKSGDNLTTIFSDELGEIPKGDDSLPWLIDQFKNAYEPTVFIVSNPSIDKQYTELGKFYKRAKDMLEGTHRRDRMLAYVAELDEDMPRTFVDLSKKENDVFVNKKYWYVANPALKDGFPRVEYIEGQIEKNIGSSVDERRVMRINFGEFTGSDKLDTLISMQLYDEIPDTLSVAERRKDWKLALGLDLSELGKGDLTALSLCWLNPNDDSLELEVIPFISDKDLIQRERVEGMPWTEWINSGYVVAVDSEWVGYEPVAEYISYVMQKNNNILGLTADQFKYKYLRKALMEKGIFKDDLKEYIHNQSSYPGGKSGKDPKNMLYMPPSITHFIRAVKEKKIRILQNPCVRAAFMGAVTISDPSLNLRLNKKSSTVRIDPAVAAIESVGLIREKGGKLNFKGYFDYFEDTYNRINL